MLHQPTAGNVLHPRTMQKNGTNTGQDVLYCQTKMVPTGEHVLEVIESSDPVESSLPLLLGSGQEHLSGHLKEEEEGGKEEEAPESIKMYVFSDNGQFLKFVMPFVI